MKNYINSGSMVYDTKKKVWKGKAYDNRVLDAEGKHKKDAAGNYMYNLKGQCKYWVQNDVVKKAAAVSIPQNATSTNAYEWKDSDVVTKVVQYKKSGYFQTAMKSNKVFAGDIIQISGKDFAGQHTMIVGQIEPDGIWVFDSNWSVGGDRTPRYHKISYSTFNKGTAFTIYRIK